MGIFHFDCVFFLFLREIWEDFHSVFHDLFCLLIIFSVIVGGGGGVSFSHPGLRNLGL